MPKKNREEIRPVKKENTYILPCFAIFRHFLPFSEQFANIYTFESPGGWNIIGNTPKKIFDDKNLDQPAFVNPGDKVSFYQITKEDYLNWNE